MEVSINLGLAVRENPLNLNLEGHSVAERLDLYAEAIESQVYSIAASMPEAPISAGVRRSDEVSVDVTLEGDSGAIPGKVASKIRSLKKYVEYVPDGMFNYIDCGKDVRGFILLARRGVAARVVHEDEGFVCRYTYLANHILVKEMIAYSDAPENSVESRLIGKTMFTDIPPGKFSEHYLASPLCELQRFSGPLKEELIAIASGNTDFDLENNGDEPLGQEFSEESAEAATVRLVPSRRFITSPGHGLFENIIFLDRHDNPVPTEQHCRSKRNERDEDFSQVDMLDADAFFLAHRDRIETIVYEHWELQGKRRAAVYQRTPKLEMYDFLREYPEVEFLPLYEFFSNFNLLDIAVEFYEYGLTYVKMFDRCLISCSVVGDVKKGFRQFSTTIQSLARDFVRGVVLDLKLAKSWQEGEAEIVELSNWSHGKKIPLRFVLRANDAQNPPEWLIGCGIQTENIFTYVDQAVENINECI